MKMFEEKVQNNESSKGFLSNLLKTDDDLLKKVLESGSSKDNKHMTSELLLHTQRELYRKGYTDKQGIPITAMGALISNIINDIEEFQEEEVKRDNRMSAEELVEVVDSICKLVVHLPLTALTMNDDEWKEVKGESGVMFYQNIRNPRYRKDTKNSPVYIQE